MAVLVSSIVIPTYCCFPSNTKDKYCINMRPFSEPNEFNNNIFNNYPNGRHETRTMLIGTATSQASIYNGVINN